MAEKTDNLYLNHIKDACSRISKYVIGIKRSSFEENQLVQDAVIRQLEIIGEAARKVSEDTKINSGFIDWKQIIGMRDKLIHDYTGIDLDVVWETVTKDIPQLQTNIKKLI